MNNAISYNALGIICLLIAAFIGFLWIIDINTKSKEDYKNIYIWGDIRSIMVAIACIIGSIAFFTRSC